MDEEQKDVSPEELEQQKETAFYDKLCSIACQQYDVGVKYRQPKLDQILKAEELYFNTIKKTLRGRFNVPLPIVSGYVETLLSKIDDEITVNYDHTEEADKIKARKVSAVWKYDSAPTRGAWAIKDILTKKLAIFSGRGIYSIFSESYPVYKNHLEIVDAFDFIAEPNGGWHLENHLFCGKQNIFRSLEELERGRQYNQAQVAKLKASAGTDEFKKAYDLYQNHQNRLKVLGLDISGNNYVGVQLFNLVQWNMEYEGQRYYLLFDPCAKIWVRGQKLEEITGTPPEGEKPKYMFVSYATHYDYWNFWSKAPVDDVVPVAVAMKTVVNFMLDDFQKKLWGQRIYDAEMISDPSQLEWDRPDKLIAAIGLPGKKISDAVYEFQTGDNSSITINLLDYFRGFVGTESGVTSQTKGNSDEKILGIAKINAGEVADRLNLHNKFYVQAHAELGIRYLYGLKECMTEKRMVRMIGENGYESAEITKEDLKFTVEPDIRITGGRSEALRMAEEKDAQNEALALAVKLAPEVFNKKVTVETILQNAKFDPDAITAMLDVSVEGDADEGVEASNAIQEILAGNNPPLYRGATTRFMKKIYDFSVKRCKNPAMEDRLVKYALAHTDIVKTNMAIKALIINAGQGTAPVSDPSKTGNSIQTEKPLIESPYVNQPTA